MSNIIINNKKQHNNICQILKIDALLLVTHRDSVLDNRYIFLPKKKLSDKYSADIIKIGHIKKGTIRRNAPIQSLFFNRNTPIRYMPYNPITKKIRDNML